MPRIPVIVGIDPGTTTGYAVLDVSGNPLELNSFKEFGLNDLVRKISSLGVPIIAGTDKHKIPEFLSQFSRKTGSKICSPSKDMKVDFKRDITSSYAFQNDHERDALAGALEAYRSYSSVLSRITRFAVSQHKREILLLLTQLVIKEDIPIRIAAQLLEEKDTETLIVKSAIKERSFTKKDFLHLYNQLKITKKASLHLKKQNHQLKKENEKQRLTIAKLEKKNAKKQSYDSKRIDTLFSHKEKRYTELRKSLKATHEQVSGLKDGVLQHQRLLIKLSNSYLLKRLRNLSNSEYEKKKSALGIVPNDMLFVDDVGIYSKRVLEELEDKVTIIVTCRKPRSDLIASFPFVIVFAKPSDLMQVGDFSLIKKTLVDRSIGRRDALQKIVMDYQKERSLSG